MFSKYEYVYEVYKEGSFTKAAEKLFISQPSLSVAVRNIEKKIGAELFERCGNGVKLTEAGKEYVLTAEQIIKAENDFKNKINDIYNLETGSISVGGSNYISSYMLPKIINRFASLHPNVDVTLTEANSTVLREMAKSGEIDIFVDSFARDADEYQKYPLSTERILLCVPKENKINHGIKDFAIESESIYDGVVDWCSVLPVPIDYFKGEKFILLKNGNDMCNRAMSIFQRSHFEPEVAFAVDQLNISCSLTDSGMGICFVTDTFFKYVKSLRNVLLYSVGDESSNRELCVAYRRNKYCTRAMSEFINVTREVIGTPNIEKDI